MGEAKVEKKDALLHEELRESRKWELDYLREARIYLTMACSRLLLNNVLQKGVRLHLQISALALLDQVHGKGSHDRLIFFLILSLITALSDAPDICRMIILSFKVIRTKLPTENEEKKTPYARRIHRFKRK